MRHRKGHEKIKVMKKQKALVKCGVNEAPQHLWRVFRASLIQKTYLGPVSLKPSRAPNRIVKTSAMHDRVQFGGVRKLKTPNTENASYEGRNQGNRLC